MVSVIYRYVTLAQCHIDLSITVLRQLSWGWEGIALLKHRGTYELSRGYIGESI